MPTDPPTDVLTIRAWVECDGARPRLVARLITAESIRAPAIPGVKTTSDDVLRSVKSWLDRLERSGVTYCDTIE